MSSLLVAAYNHAPAPTLDEKAWEHYSRQTDKYDGVDQALDKLFAPDVDVLEQDIALRAL